MPELFAPITFRDVTLPNRIVVSPMCQYSSVDGHANDWHVVHLGSRAVGGAGLVLTEAAAVSPDGRISPADLGIWDDRHVPALQRITAFIHQQGSIAGVQLAHAGRKASVGRPWEGGGGVSDADGGWQPAGPTADPFSPGLRVPHAMTAEECAGVVAAFAGAALRARHAGFRVVEVHAAHGYLVHSFLSPLSNTRTDRYGGSFENRIRLCLEIVAAIREVWLESLPVFVRISATDWLPGGWDVEQSVELARRLRTAGVDLVDCSSGGNLAHATIPIGPGYQVPFAERIRRDAGIPTGAVGLITTPAQAQQIVAGGQADCVFLAREMLRDPYWPLRAARELGVPAPWPVQYLRAAPPHTHARAHH